MRSLLKRTFCFLLSVTMVFSMMPAVAKAENNTSTKRLYFELPENTAACDWVVNNWKDRGAAIGDSKHGFCPNGWGDNYNFPALLSDEKKPGWGYIDISGEITGLQFVDRNAVEYNCWNPHISDMGLDEAYYVPDENAWYVDSSKTELVPAIVFIVAGDGVLTRKNWDIDVIDNSGLMFQSLENRNIYSVTFENVEPFSAEMFEGGNHSQEGYEYKIFRDTAQKGWNEAWTEGENRIVEVKEKSNVTFTIDVTDGSHSVKVDVIPVDDAENPDEGDDPGEGENPGEEEASGEEPAQEESELLPLNAASFVELVIDDNSYDMDLYLGFYEKGVSLSEGKHSVKINVDGKEYIGGKEITISEGETETVHFRLKNGELKDSVNNADVVYEHATLVGNFFGIEFLDDFGERFDISGWNPADNKGDLEYIGGGLYKRTFKFKPLENDLTLNDSGYKVAFNNELDSNNDNNWKYSLGDNGNNISLTIPKDASEWTILVDEVNKAVYDNFRMPSFTTHHNDGEVSRNPFYTTVTLEGDMNGWNQAPGNGYDFELISDGLYRYSMKLNQASYGCKVVFDGDKWYEKHGQENHTFVVDNDNTNVVIIYDAKNDEIYDSISNTNTVSKLTKLFTERIPFVPGTFPGPNWDPASNKMEKLENGNFAYTFEKVPAGHYEYKIAFETWDENYGVSGARDGANYGVYVPTEQDVTIYYSDKSHLSVNSVDYKNADVWVNISADERFKLSDDELTGVYSGKALLKAGEYTGVTVTSDETTVFSGDIKLDNDKEVTFFYSPYYEICYHDASGWKADNQKIKYDSKNIEYKNPFGAVATGENVTFSVDTDENITGVSLRINQGNNTAVPLELVSENDGIKHWSASTSFNEIGECTYFFTLSSGDTLRVYSDDWTGDYGTGAVSDLSNFKPYDLTVYDSSYKTPDWMKNAVIYQIFPDRFADGDSSNNMAQTSSRGDTNYEFPEWNAIPENPEQEDILSEDVYKATGAFYGDRNWSNEMYGGDFKGIVENIDYLKALGVNVIYLNPVFSSISSHRYDATDYGIIDPILGDLGDFEELVKIAEENNMKIVLDGVFNHVSDDSIYFDRYYKFLTADDFDGKMGAYPYWAFVYDDMKDNGSTKDEAETKARAYFKGAYDVTDFSYTTWFAVYDSYLGEGNIFDRNGLRPDRPVYGYEGWWGYDSMPVIKSTNGSEYQTEDWAKTIIGKADANGSYEDNDSIAQYWISKGSNGWRLDVANEVSDETWQNFRKSVRAMDSDAVIIGEIWDDATHYLKGDMYDSVMNYVFRGAVLDFAKGGNSSASMATLERIRERYPKEAFYAMMNLVDSHDTSRVLSFLDGIGDDRNQKDIKSAFPTYEGTSALAKERQKLAAFIQFTYPGAPTIYYGDEVGVVGADDPDDRRTINWGSGDETLVNYYAKLGAIRNAYSALRTGDIVPLNLGNENVFGFVRSDEQDTLIVLANNKTEAISLNVNVKELGLDCTKTVTDVVSGEIYEASEEINVSIPANRGVILTNEAKEITYDSESLKVAFDPTFVPSKDEDVNPTIPDVKDEENHDEKPSEAAPQAIEERVLEAAPIEARISEIPESDVPLVEAIEIEGAKEAEQLEESVNEKVIEEAIEEAPLVSETNDTAIIEEESVPEISGIDEKKNIALPVALSVTAAVAVAGAGAFAFRFKFRKKR